MLDPHDWDRSRRGGMPERPMARDATDVPFSIKLLDELQELVDVRDRQQLSCDAPRVVLTEHLDHALSVGTKADPEHGEDRAVAHGERGPDAAAADGALYGYVELSLGHGASRQSNIGDSSIASR
jgi:hypothetical protein